MGQLVVSSMFTVCIQCVPPSFGSSRAAPSRRGTTTTDPIFSLRFSPPFVTTVISTRCLPRSRSPRSTQSVGPASVLAYCTHSRTGTIQTSQCSVVKSEHSNNERYNGVVVVNSYTNNTVVWPQRPLSKSHILEYSLHARMLTAGNYNMILQLYCVDYCIARIYTS